MADHPRRKRQKVEDKQIEIGKKYSLRRKDPTGLIQAEFKNDEIGMCMFFPRTFVLMSREIFMKEL